MYQQLGALQYFKDLDASLKLKKKIYRFLEWTSCSVDRPNVIAFIQKDLCNVPF